MSPWPSTPIDHVDSREPQLETFPESDEFRRHYDEGIDSLRTGIRNDGTSDQLWGGSGADLFIRHRNLFGPTIFDNIMDLDDLDRIFTRWHLHM